MVKIKNNDSKMPTKRLETLVDGIFAIAMTLLVLSLAVPQITGSLTEKAVENALYGVLSNFYTLVLSFILLAIFWKIHHQVFNHLKYINGTMLWINIIWLLFIVLVPFSSSLVGDYGQFFISHVIFNINLLGIAVLQYLNWFFAKRSGFIHEKMDVAHITAIERTDALFIGIVLLALILSYFIPNWSETTYILMIPLERLIKR